MTERKLSTYDENLLAKCRAARELYTLNGVGPKTAAQRQLVHDLCDGINHLLHIKVSA